VPLDPLSPAAFAFIAQVEATYAAMMRLAAGHEVTGLRGKLFYAGELDGAGRAFACAGNIAGAATLAASADQAARKQAMRDGIIDFLVTSLDEALRILKNEVRKGETVAVCVGAAPEEVEREMRERGVLPDLLFDQIPENAAGRSQLDDDTAATPSAASDTRLVWLTWRVAREPAVWLPKLDAIVLSSFAADDWFVRRWLERAPRYLGRLAQGARMVQINKRLVEQILSQINRLAENGEIAVPIKTEIGPWGQSSL
jgi:urocanate hydratase